MLVPRGSPHAFRRPALPRAPSHIHSSDVPSLTTPRARQATRVALVVALVVAVLPRAAAAQRPDSVAGSRPARPARGVADSLLARELRRVTPAGDSSGIRLCAGGDVTLGTNLPQFAVRVADTTAAARRIEAARAKREGRRPRLPRVDTIPSRWTASPDRLLAPLRPLVRDADLVLLNVEGAIGEGETASKCGPRSTLCFAFRMPPAAASALRGVADSATVVGNVANNHARDAGPIGFDSTVAHLERAGVVVTGVDTLATIAVTSAGDTVAFLGFATSGPGTPDGRDVAAVRRHVARAAEQWSRLVVTMHLGSEGVGAQRTRDTTETLAGGSRGNVVAFARAAVESGADIVIGHGPHVLRAIEWRDSVPVLYSLGNLVTYGPFSNRTPIDRGAIACAVLDADGRARDVELRATVQRTPGDVTPDASGRAYELVDSLSRLDFPGTGARVTRDGRVTRRESSVTRQR
jgi:hypothetical protein